jgi:hypothetical protein
MITQPSMIQGFGVGTFEQETQEGHTGIEELQDIEGGAWSARRVESAD